MSREFVIDVPVRWGDLDAYNHVNNTAFLRYIEEARILLFEGMGDAWLATDNGPVVVNINCNFRREIHYPATVRVITAAHRASEKRMVMTHRLVDAANPERLYADAEVTVLWVDKKLGGSVPLPAAVVAALEDGD